MSCHIEEVEGVFGPGKTLIFYCYEGTQEPPEPCRFCGSPAAEFLCDWPEEKTESVAVEDLVVGDIRVLGGKQDRARLASIEYSNGETASLVWEWIGRGGGTQPVKCPVLATFRVLRMGTCDAPCCPTCARELEEIDEAAGKHGKHYCADHWGAWERVA